MDYNTRHQILKYLDRYFYTKETRIFRKDGDIHEWGLDVAEWVSEIFTCRKDECCNVIIDWAQSQEGIKPSDIHRLWAARVLKFVWSIDMADELAMRGISNVQVQMNDLIINGLSREIDTSILKQLKEHIKDDTDLKSLIRCIGYTTSPIIYNPTTLKPEQRFISVKYHEMIDERQSNNIWQNHFRPTRADEQTQVTI